MLRPPLGRGLWARRTREQPRLSRPYGELSEELACSSVVADFATTQRQQNPTSAKFAQVEVPQNPTVANFATVQQEGGREVVRKVEYYSLDVILSVGYRVKSVQGILFRR